MSDRRESWGRRDFLGGLTLAGSVGLLGVHVDLVAAEPRPETTRIRLSKVASVCVAPQYVAEEFLKSEGFTDVQYVSEKGPGTAAAPWPRPWAPVRSMSP